MAAFYLDTSALVKGYAQEDGTTWVTALLTSLVGHEIYTTRVAGPEMVAAFARKARTAAVTPDEAARITDVFRYDWQQRRFFVLDVTADVTERAMDLAKRQNLRGYDAVHLATALEVQAVRRSLGLADLVFVSADNAQRHAAATEGLITADPADHPAPPSA